jgi:hypothetical protein
MQCEMKIRSLDLCGLVVWLQTQRPRVPLQALPDFLRSGGSGMGSTLPREDK